MAHGALTLATSTGVAIAAVVSCLLALGLGWPLGMAVRATLQMMGWLLAGLGCCIPIVVVGRVLLARLWPEVTRTPPALLIACSWVVGWAVVMVAGIAMLAAGVYSPLAWALASSAGWVSILGWLAWRRWRPLSALTTHLTALWSAASRTPALSGATLAGALLVLSGLVASTPPTTRDELAYHLVLPRQWAAEGDWSTPVDNPHHAFPANAELMWAYAEATGGPRCPRFVTWVSALLTTLVLAEWMRGRGTRRWARGASLVFLLVTPVAAIAAASCYVEWPMALALIVGWLVVREPVVRDAGGAGLAVVACGWGAASGMKYTGLALAAVLALDLASDSRLRGSLRVARAAAVVALGLALLAAPWYARNALLHDDPIYPLGDLISASSSDTVARTVVDYAGLTGWWRAAPWAYHATLDTTADHRLHLLWPLLHMVAIAWGWRRRRELPWLAVVVSTALLLPFTPAPRVELPLMLLTWMFLPGVLEAMTPRVAERALTGSAVALVALVSVPFIVHDLLMTRERAVQDFLIGRIDEQELLRREGALTPTVAWVREQTPADARIWVWCEDRTLYLDRWVRADGPYGPPAFLDILTTSGLDGLEARAARDLVDYLLVDHARCPDSWSVARWEGGEQTIGPSSREQLARWRTDRLSEIGRDRRYVLYRVDRPVSPGRRPAAR